MTQTTSSLGVLPRSLVVDPEPPQLWVDRRLRHQVADPRVDRRRDADEGRTSATTVAVEGSKDLVEPGERMLVACEGGPSQSRLVTWPPPLEILERGGIYVLDDDGADPREWRYVFIANA